MNERTKNILLGVLIVGIISMTVAYASLTQNLRINSSAKVQGKSTSWNIHFKHIEDTSNEVQPKEYATAASNSITLSETDTVATMPTVTLKAPGDSVEFYFNVINEGEITGYVNIVNNITIPDPEFAQDETLTEAQRTELKNSIQATLTYANGNAINVGDSIAKDEEKQLKLVIRFVDNGNTAKVDTKGKVIKLSNVKTGNKEIAAQVLPSKNVTFSGITASLVYGQSATPGGSTPSNPYETTFDGDYIAYKWYDVDNSTPSYGQYENDSSWNTSLNPESKAYLRTTGSLPEICGVFGSGQSGTACMTSSYYNSDYSSAGSGYDSDFEEVSNYGVVYTVSELQATGLKGYALAKAEEMLSKGASSCRVISSSVNCDIPSGGYCTINGNGNVLCYGDDGDDVHVNNDGSAH